MIFVTVGTHEQQFNRLIKAIDRLKGENMIEDEVLIQTGYSDYEPVHCAYRKLFSYRDMARHIEQARIVITHGGPSSFFAPLQIGKIPIVVPRQARFEEHVNDHQLDFARQVEQRYHNIIVVEDVGALGEVLRTYDERVKGMDTQVNSNNAQFNERLSGIVAEMFAERKRK